MGACIWLKLVIVWGTLSSSTRKYSFFRPGMKDPSLDSTPTSSVTNCEATRMEKLSRPSTFLGALGASSFLGSSSFFLGTAIGPISPCGPPASAGALGCGDALGVGVGLGCFCPPCACATGASIHRTVISASKTTNRKQAFPLEIRCDSAVCIKSISHCLFMSLYISIDARTQLFRSLFPALQGRFVGLYLQNSGLQYEKSRLVVERAVPLRGPGPCPDAHRQPDIPARTSRHYADHEGRRCAYRNE